MANSSNNNNNNNKNKNGLSFGNTSSTLDLGTVSKLLLKKAEQDLEDELNSEGRKILKINKAENEVWNSFGNYFKKSNKSNQINKLPAGVYVVHNTPEGYVLEIVNEKYDFNYKIYGLESKLIARVEKTYNSTKGNLGMIFNGKKGTGKTVTAKQICNNFNLPVILLTFKDEQVQNYINSFQQDIVVFIDEYEKIFEGDADLLSVMDGALDATFRRVFILTTNTLHINENLIERPGRIRYVKTFRDLTPEIIEEVVDDLLKHKQFRNDTIRFISSLESITIDIAKAVINEINIHCEKPDEFADVFNVKKLNDKYDISIVCEEETEWDKKYISLFKNIKTDFHNYENFDPTAFSSQNGYQLWLENVGIRITLKESIDSENFNAEMDLQNLYHNSTYYKTIEDKFVQTGILPKNIPAKGKKPIVKFKLKISKSWSVNKNFRNYDGFDY